MITIDDFKANTKEWLIDKLGGMSREDALQTISDLYDELHKSKYLKTYEECCQHLGCDDKIKMKLIGQFTRLINTRNAYWKIAGEEMGLGKPWEPDWTTSGQCRYTIETNYNKFIFSKTQYGHRVLLVFPTMEMRDAFYENFKDLIEQCKELL